MAAGIVALKEIWRLRVLTIVATIMIVIVIVGGGAIGVRVAGLFVEVSDDWNQYQEVALQKAIYLSRIRREFGYGGFIHNFKNYILRQQDRYLDKATEDIARLEEAIAGYGALATSSWESSALVRLGATVEDYDGMIAVARQQVTLGSTPRITDEWVKVEDAMALAALDSLETVWEQVQKTETARISQIVADGRLSINLGIILVPILVLCGIVFFVLLRKLTALTAEKIHSEQRLQESERELRELSDIKNKFLGIAAHDLRNPLGAIRTMSEMITLLDLSEEKKKDFNETIKAVCDQMLALLNDLLDISAIESGEFTLKVVPDDIGEVVRNRTDLTALIAKPKGIHIVTEIGEVPVLEFDRERIFQVLDNLLGNAVKFSPADSTVRATTETAADGIRIAISDEGPGIPPEEQARLFGTFEKLSVQPTGGEKSTGLGLAIVKKIVDAHGGKIIVESEIGVGSTFTVVLPTTPNSISA